MTQISVIVLTYNPDNAKLRRTLAAAAAQQDVTMEVIISDDGSAKKDFSFLPDYITEEAAERGHIKRLNLEGFQPDLWKQILYHRDKWISPSMDAVIQILTDNWL